jgi:hypothetical protein
MYLGYVDDAGNTGQNITDKHQPYHFVGAIMFHHEHWRGIRDALRAIQDSLPHGIGTDASFEFRGAYLFNGTGRWQPLSLQERLQVYGQCVDLLAAHDITIVYGCCNKQLLRR